jgi:hypothetical protein
MTTSEELQRELAKFLQSVEWNVIGIQTRDNQTIPMPPESRIVTVILQALAAPVIFTWAKKHEIKVEDLVEETRGYPDFALSEGPLNGRLVALDVKSARYAGHDSVSRMTLGTYDGYFLHPDERRLSGGARCYNDYDEHWVVAFIYKWDPKKDTPSMVEIVERIVAHKWQLASRTSGSGDTANIGGLSSLSALKALNSEFQNEDEFEKYWRQYAVKHPRKRTRAPKT